MANIVRIRDIHLYTALSDDAQECRNAVKFLRDKNIPFSHLNWHTDEEFNKTFEPIRTWHFSADGVNSAPRHVDKYPFAHWRIIFDDDSHAVNVAVGLEEIQNSQLVTHDDKIVRNT